MRHPRKLSACVLLTAGAVLTLACATSPVAPATPRLAVTGRADAIDRYLTGRELDAVEGIWVWSDSGYEVAIFRSPPGVPGNHQYIGVITDSERTNWKTGEVKLELKETASPAIFTGIYRMGNKSRQGTSFIMSNRNLIELQIPSGPYGTQEKVLLVRAFPKDHRSLGGVSATEPTSSGSGFVVSPSLVATNFHVVSQARSLVVVIGNERVPAKVLMQDQSNDLALLQLQFEAGIEQETFRAGVSCVPIQGDTPISAGDPVFALGFPLSDVLGSEVAVSEGLVNSTVGVENDPRMLQISVPIQPGNSGGPLFDRQGHLVGVVTSTLNNEFLFATQRALPQNVNFAIRTSYVASLLSLLPTESCALVLAPSKTELDAREIRDKFQPATVRIEVVR